MAKLKTAKNLVLYTIGEILPRVLAFLLLPVLTRYLTTSDYGISSYINTVLSFLYVLTTLSINTYALRTYYKVNSEIEKKKLVGNIFLFLNAWGLIMLCLEAALFPVLLNAFSIKVPFYPYFLLGLIINFFDVASIIPLITYRVSENAKGFIILSVGRTIAQYCFVLLFLVVFKLGLLGSFLGRLAASVPFFIIYILVIRRTGIFSFNISQIKDALKFSLPLLPGALSYLVISLFDRIILERYASLSELGIYSVASTLALALNVVIQGLYRSFEQTIFREHNNKGYLQFVDKIYKFYIASLYISGFLLVLFTKEVLIFFTSAQYYAASNYIVYLVFAVIVSGMNIFLSTLLIADNRRKIVSYSSFVAAIVSFVSNLFLIKYYNIFGACIASILSFLSVSVFYYVKTNLSHRYLFQQLAFTIILFSSYYLTLLNLPVALILLIKILLIIGFLFLIKTSLSINIPDHFKIFLSRTFAKKKHNSSALEIK